MKTIKIVAFLQNPWFPPGTKKEHIDRYRTDQEFHRRLLAQTMTGVRLKQAFGDEMFQRIWWDNASTEHAEEAKGRTPADIAHIERVIKEQNPDLILTFGKMATDAVRQSVGAIKRKVMECHHPNARYKTMADLMSFAYEMYQWVLVQERGDIDE